MTLSFLGELTQLPTGIHGISLTLQQRFEIILEQWIRSVKNYFKTMYRVSIKSVD
jgi:hypothetical protein